MSTNLRTEIGALLSVLLFALWLRIPFIYEGSPYFYREDEAHHFNRLANMLKSGDLNPHYFHKPSLHFYLRLPVLAAAVQISKRKGELTSSADIVTTDPFGIADYSFSASHPRLVHSNRVLSLSLQILSILLTYCIGARLLRSKVAALFAAALFAVSPAAMSESSVIGVDVVMTFFCLLSVRLGLRAHDKKNWSALALCGLCAGLAVSSKYNALPIVIVPTLLYLFSPEKNLRLFLAAFLTPLIAFFAASPYIIVSFSEFVSQLSYEVWHYAVAGHEGHMAEPGLAQLLFYGRWLARTAVGIVALSLALCGLVLLLNKRSRKEDWLVFSFGLGFFLLMIAQKVNFERNMTVIIPFVALLAASALSHFSKIIPKLFSALLIVLGLAQPIYAALLQRSSVASMPESRILASAEIESFAQQQQEIAVDGRLQFQRTLLEQPGVSRTSFTQNAPWKLYLEGFNYLVVPPLSIPFDDHFQIVKSFPGVLAQQRIIQNPSFSIAQRKWPPSPSMLALLTKQTSTLTLDFKGHSELNFASLPEGHVWLTHTVEKLEVRSTPKEVSSLQLTLFSPWANQRLEFLSAGASLKYEMKAGEILAVDLPYNARTPSPFTLLCSQVHSPKALGISDDARRLGVAIKNARLGQL